MASVLLLAICGWSPLGPAGVMALEDRFPRPVIDGPVAAIILLGGAVDTHISSDRGIPTMNEAAERLTATADLQPALSGSKDFPFGWSKPYPRRQCQDVGMPGGARDPRIAWRSAQRIEMEERSRNTY